MAPLLKLTSMLSLALAVMAIPHHEDALAKRVPGEVELQKRFSNARFTFRDFEGSVGACGNFINNNDFAVALNSAQFGTGFPGPNCFRRIRISFEGKTATATILDQCPGCPQDGLDLTPGLFRFFAPLDRGIIFGEWDFIN